MTTILVQAVKLWLYYLSGRIQDLNREDIQSLTRISRSLWGDLDRSVEMSEVTLSSVSLLNLSTEMTLERASKVMVERAEKNPPAILKLNHPFFRLAAIERFLLTALHLEKWTYAKVSRTLGIEESLIETWAWATRLKYGFQELGLTLNYPHGPASLGPVCPEFNPSNPWTQRMLDDQLGKRERMFLQNHVMGCDRCRKSLDHTQKLFYKIESLIPVQDHSPELDEATNRLLNGWQQGQVIRRPIFMTPEQSFISFLSEPKVQIALGTLAFIGLVWITKHVRA